MSWPVDKKTPLQEALDARAERVRDLKAKLAGREFLDVGRLEAALLRHPALLTALTRSLDEKYVRPWEHDQLSGQWERLTLLGRKVGSVSPRGVLLRWGWSVVAPGIERHGREYTEEGAKAAVDALLVERGWVLGDE